MNRDASRKQAVRTMAIAIALTLSVAPAVRADWSVDIFGPHGSVSFGDRPFVEYANVQVVPSYHDVLSPYGEWRTFPDHGEVWMPFVDSGWRPYTYGQWVFTSSGWMWVNYEPWGYIPHHYGDWRYVGGYGWAWIPGYEWSPARVSWYESGSYVGWYPRGAFGSVDIDINLVTIVNVNMFTSPRIHDVLIAPSRIDRNVLSAMRTPKAFHQEAPERAFIQKHVQQRIEPVELDERELKVGDRAIRVAAPKGEVRKRLVEEAKVVAPKVVRSKAQREAAGAAPSKEDRPRGGVKPEAPEGRGEKADTGDRARPERATKPEREAAAERPKIEGDRTPEKASGSQDRPEKATRPETRPEAKPEKAAKPETRPEARPEKAAKPETRPEARPEKATKPQSKPEARPEKATKPQAKPEAKPEAKAPKGEAKEEAAPGDGKGKAAKDGKKKEGAAKESDADPVDAKPGEGR